MSAKAGNIVIRILALLCALVMLALAAYGQDITVKVVRFAGKVEVRASGQTAWAKIQAGQLLKAGDTLRTMKGGKVQLLFPQNTLVLIKENSVLNVKELKAGGGSKVKAVVGGFLFNLQEALSPGSTFEVETPTALAVVRGTKLGIDVALDGTSDFIGYDGSFDVIAQGVTRTVGAGQRVGVSPGAAPGEVQPSDATWEGSGGGDAEPGAPAFTAQQYSSGFNTLANRFRLLAARMNTFYEEYIRYEAEGDLARNELIFYSMQPIMEQCDQFDAGLEELIGNLQEDANLGWVINGGDPTPGTEETGANIQGYIASCRASSAQIRSQYASILTYISANLDPQEVLDQIQGLIQSDNPAMDIRYGNIDTDNDGIPDVVELRLTGEAAGDEPLITLIEPNDEALFNYPEDNDIHFEFEAVGESFFKGFDLYLEASGNGNVWVRHFVDTSMDLTLDEIINSTSFRKLFEPGETVEFTWFVHGNFDFNQWGAHIGAGHGVSSLLAIDSDTRTLKISYPEAQVVEFNLDPLTPSVQMGDPITLRVECSEVFDLGKWQIVINYDPSQVEFDSGQHTGITSGITLFFGDDGRGHLTISGETGAATAPLEGQGMFAEIKFSALEPGVALFDFNEIELWTPAEQVIEGVAGEGAEVDIAGQLGQ